MRSFYNQSKFFQKMKKKSDVQEVLDNLENYTENQINELSGTHFPMWIKEELINLKKRNGKTPEEEAQRIANIMIAASQKKN